MSTQKLRHNCYIDGAGSSCMLQDEKYCLQTSRIFKTEIICYANNFAICEAAIFIGSQTGEAGGT
jgi:hypothetical protein